MLIMGGGLLVYFTEPQRIAKMTGLLTTLGGMATQIRPWVDANAPWRQTESKAS